MTLSDELDEWVLENAFKGNGEVRSGGNGLNVYMRVRYMTLIREDRVP